MDFLFTLFVICVCANIVRRTASQNITFGPSATLMEDTGSSVKIRWDFWDIEDPDDAVKNFHVEYRSENEIEKPAMLVKATLVNNPDSTYFNAQEAGKHRVTPDVSYTRSAFYTKIFSTYMEITVTNLKFAHSNYRFDLSRTLNGQNDTYTSRPTAVIEIATLSVVRSRRVSLSSSHYPVRTGLGCFRVLELNKESRKVKIFWQPIRDFGKLRVTIMDIDEKAQNPQETEYRRLEVDADQGSIVVNISLNLHRVIFRPVIDYGLSRGVKYYSMLYITAQDKLLIAPRSDISWDKQANITTLTWQKPKNLTFDSFTVFWMNNLDGRASPLHGIFDFAIVKTSNQKKDKYEFKIKGNSYKLSGLSVNMGFASSGLSLPCGY